MQIGRWVTLPDGVIRDGVSIYLGPLGCLPACNPKDVKSLGLTVAGVKGFSRPLLEGWVYPPETEGPCIITDYPTAPTSLSGKMPVKVLSTLNTAFLSGFSAADWASFFSVSFPEASFATISSELVPFERSKEFLTPLADVSANAANTQAGTEVVKEIKALSSFEAGCFVLVTVEFLSSILKEKEEEKEPRSVTKGGTKGVARKSAKEGAVTDAAKVCSAILWGLTVYFLGLLTSVRGVKHLHHSVLGVSVGFSRKLQLVGVGYSVTLFTLGGKEVKSLLPGSGGRVVLGLGYSHSLTWWLLPESVGKLSARDLLEKYGDGPGSYANHAAEAHLAAGKDQNGSKSQQYFGDPSCGVRLLPLSRASSKVTKGAVGGKAASSGAGKAGKGGSVGEVVPTRKFVVLGYEKDKVHQFAAELRNCRAPSVYKGRGVSVVGEALHLKAGKTK
jgi:ribosomal protein L6P/L9E